MSEGALENLTRGTNAESRQAIRLAAKIFEKYGDWIYAMVCFNANNGVEADDIFQDFFLSLMHHPIPADIEEIKSYIYRAIANDVLDAVRKKKSQRAQLLKYYEHRRNKVVQHDPLDCIIQIEERKKMVELIKQHLPPHEANAVIRRCYNGKSTEEVAKEINVNKRSASRYLCVGLKKLRKLIKENS